MFFILSEFVSFLLDQFAVFNQSIPSVGTQNPLTITPFQINREYLLNSTNGLLVNGHLIIYCEVSYHLKMIQILRLIIN